MATDQNTPSRQFSAVAQGNYLGKLATFETDMNVSQNKRTNDKNQGSLAGKLAPKEGKENINVVSDYKWTLSNLNDVSEIPYIRLREFAVNESQIRKQGDFYANLGKQLGEAVGKNASDEDILNVYDALWPKDNPTKFVYKFPYFNETGFSLQTGEWKTIDPIGSKLASVAGSVGDLASKYGEKGKQVSEGMRMAGAIGSFLGGASNLMLEDTYPSVGVFDRPRIFAGHGNRTVTISFPLFNTVAEQDWNDNRDLIYLLMNQNLFNKRDYITGLPPVFYDVYVPGQYYCYAATMSDIKVDNLGNQRLLYGSYIAPDAYQVTLTLTEAVMPSRNQFEAITNGQAQSNVVTSTTRKKTGNIEGIINTVEGLFVG